MEVLKKAAFIIKRLGACLVTLVSLSFIIFSLLFLAPGDPARNLVGTRRATPELLAQIRAQHHLDDPFLSQYTRWISGALNLDFGRSIRTNVNIIDHVSPHAGVTFQLVGMSLVFSLCLGLPLGIISAKNKGKKLDGAINVMALVGTSAPSFAVGLLLLYFFAFRLRIFPMYGAQTVGHLILPAITLSFGISAFIIKITRQAMLMEIGSDYTVFMRSRSVAPYKIMRAQLKNAASPVLTSTGLVLASLFGSTVLVESIFSIPGLGSLLASAVTFRDVPVVQFIALMLAVAISLTSAFVDILVYLLNPNMQKESTVSQKRGES